MSDYAISLQAFKLVAEMNGWTETAKALGEMLAREVRR